MPQSQFEWSEKSIGYCVFDGERGRFTFGLETNTPDGAIGGELRQDGAVIIYHGCAGGFAATPEQSSYVKSAIKKFGRNIPTRMVPALQ